MLAVVSVADRFLASLQHHQYLAFLAVHLLDALLQHLNGLLERHHLGTEKNPRQNQRPGLRTSKTTIRFHQTWLAGKWTIYR